MMFHPITSDDIVKVIRELNAEGSMASVGNIAESFDISDAQCLRFLADAIDEGKVRYRNMAFYLTE